MKKAIQLLLIKKKGWSFFLATGIAASTMTYTGENLITVDGLDDMGRFKYNNNIITHSYLPLIAVGADFYINSAIRRFFIRTEILAANIKSTVKSHYKFSIYSATESDYTYRFSSWKIGFRPQIFYNLYNTPKYKWYLGAGFSLNYLANSDNSMEERDSQSGNVMTATERFFPLKTIVMNAIVRSGLRINERLDLSVMWDSPVENTNYAVSKQSAKTSLLSFLISFNFNK